MALETPVWLSGEFIEKVLRKSEKDESIRVVDMSVKAATNKGDNYTSEMHRATVNFSRDRNGRRITEKRPLIVKVAPEGGQREDMIANSGLFVTEMAMMSDTLVKMNRSLGSVTPLGARSLYVQPEKPTLLVFEDLAPRGFRMADRQSGLDLAHSLLAIRGIAKLHASSVALHEKDPKAVRKYGKGMFNKGHPAAMKAFFISSVKALGEEVAKWPELGPRYSEKIMNLSPMIYDKASEAAAFKEDDFNVLNHGDFWVNNMLFRYDAQGKPIDHIFVDFQLCVYTSPAIDLLYFLNTSPSEEVSVNSQELLLREYQSSLATTMLQMDCNTPAPSYEELKSSLKERAIYGMTAAFCVLPLVLNDSSQVKSLDEMMDENGVYKNPAYQGKLYRNAMLRLLPIYDKMGLLDV